MKFDRISPRILFTKIYGYVKIISVRPFAAFLTDWPAFFAFKSGFAARPEFCAVTSRAFV